MNDIIRKKSVSAILVLGTLLLFAMPISANAAGSNSDTKIISSCVYELDEKADYDIANGNLISETCNRFSLSGPISEVSQKNGVPSYGVNVDLDEVLEIQLTDISPLLSINGVNGWEPLDDGASEIEAAQLDAKIQSGTIIIQTSKDKNVWVIDKSYADVFNSTLESLNAINNSLYAATSAQLDNGCYYRIIVAYKLQHRLEDSKIAFYTKKNYETKRVMEVYEFYAHNINVDISEPMDADAYKLGDMDYLVRCKDDEYSGSLPIDSEDPHSSWQIGKFYISGYTDKTEWDNEAKDPIFLKTIGDKVTLWFNLEQDINKCNGTDAIKVIADTDGSDQNFQTPRTDFGKGMLIVKKTDVRNGKSIQYYRNYLEASATAGANTRIDLLEEGDYEIALDYALEYDKTKLFGHSVLPKTLHYRVNFKFSVRNGDSKLFIRDAVTNEFIDNANIAENGFYIDLAKQQYLTLTLKREVMTDSLDGLIADSKFNGVAKEGRIYTDEGIYTITAKNKYTAAPDTVKKVYVGDSDVLKAYTKEGNTYTVSQINELIATGAHVEEDGTLVLPIIPDPPAPDVPSGINTEELLTMTNAVAKDSAEEESIVNNVDPMEENAAEVSEAPNTANNMFLPIILGSVAVLSFIITILYRKKKNTSHQEGA